MGAVGIGVINDWKEVFCEWSCTFKSRHNGTWQRTGVIEHACKRACMRACAWLQPASGSSQTWVPDNRRNRLRLVEISMKSERAD